MKKNRPTSKSAPKSAPKLPRAFSWKRKLILIATLTLIGGAGCYIASTMDATRLPLLPGMGNQARERTKALWSSKNGQYEVVELEPGFYYFDHKHDQCLADIVALNVEQKGVLYLQNARGECFRVNMKSGKIEKWSDLDAAPQESRPYFETYCYEMTLPTSVDENATERYYRNRYAIFKRDDGKSYFWGTTTVKGEFTEEQTPYVEGERPLKTSEYDKETKKLNLTFEDGTPLTVPPFPLYNKIDGEEIFE